LEPEPKGVFLRELYAAGNAFYDALGAWLETEAGSQYKGDVILTEDSATQARVMYAARVRVRMEPISTTSGDKEGVPCLKKTRDIIDRWSEDHVPDHDKDNAPVPFVSFNAFRFWDASAVIVEQTAFNMIYAAACCFVVTLVVLPHPMLCVIAMVTVSSILAGVVAAMALMLDIRIETISMIDLVMSIGFSIDNVAHFCHAYMISRQPTAKEKAVDALQMIGIPILLGDASTMVALLPLVGSKSRIFISFFYILFTVLLLSALHAIVLLPLVLGYFGPLPQYADREGHEGRKTLPIDNGAGIGDQELGTGSLEPKEISLSPLATKGPTGPVLASSGVGSISSTSLGGVSTTPAPALSGPQVQVLPVSFHNGGHR